MKKFVILIGLMLTPTVAHGYEDELRQLERTKPSDYTLEIIESIRGLIPVHEAERFDNLVRKHRDVVLAEQLHIPKR